MQRAWTSRLKIALKIALPILVVALCVSLDQLSKFYIKMNFSRGEKKFLIPNFFYFTYTVNTGAAWSFLADKAWGQTFFKVLTSIALVAFVAFFAFSIIKNLKWLSYSLGLVIGGTIGNFIDRIFFGGVTDFIGVLFGEYAYPIFNLADSFLVVGLIMIIFYYLFLDSNAIFRFKKKNNSDVQTLETTNLEDQNIDGKEDISNN